MTVTLAAPIPCKVCTHPVTPDEDRAVVLTAEVGYHQPCFRSLLRADVGVLPDQPLTRRGMGRRWRVGDRCRMGGAA